ncbi:FtsH protease activity modulator HflK [Psychrosphaera algicola]|uniref:Protein HflK n=1 Tax=Psychrosphaera algicola TaxID=3023714 RepID=A0ABT5F8X2_9GAMM|nr:FtsH protease activity modulator HflK [Psychrosphaera sp. G1-22]MDC2887978.1 FtsH protease activity modulator HflK [Psychrosphaera sp. G1-22]
MIICIVLLLVLTGYTSLYTVPSDSVAVVLRFGKFEVIKPSGLHFKMPLGIDKVNIVPTKRQLKQEFGFSTHRATDPNQNSTPNSFYSSAKSKAHFLSNQIGETQMVTGDLNTALVEWVVQYRIADPKYYLFEVRDPAGTLRYVSESVMREVVGDRTVDEVITIGRQEIEVEALSKMQALASKYVMGIRIDQVQLKNINPPQPVQASFNKVNQAQQEKEKLINEARRDYNRVIPLAEGESDQRIREADGYRLKRINEAEGNVLRFNALFKEYLNAPEVTRRRLYLETMQKVLPKIDNKIIIDTKVKSVLPLLNLTTEESSE